MGATQRVERVLRDFAARSAAEQTWLVDNTWCERCRMYDLGMNGPEEYEEEGRIFVEGTCRICRGPITNEIVDQRKL